LYLNRHGAVAIELKFVYPRLMRFSSVAYRVQLRPELKKLERPLLDCGRSRGRLQIFHKIKNVTQTSFAAPPGGSRSRGKAASSGEISVKVSGGDGASSEAFRYAVRIRKVNALVTSR
jgi:hypothetical protein